MFYYQKIYSFQLLYDNLCSWEIQTLNMYDYSLLLQSMPITSVRRSWPIQIVKDSLYGW